MGIDYEAIGARVRKFRKKKGVSQKKVAEIVGVDTCEGGRWPAYITPDMFMLPCSFDNQEWRWAVSLRDHTIEETWNSEPFADFRRILRDACPG